MAFVKFSNLARGEALGGDRFSFLITVASLIMSLAQISLILYSWGKLPPRLPIFYSNVWGQAILGPPLALWILPIFSVGAIVLNLTLGYMLSKGNFFLMRTLTIFGFLVSILCLWGLNKIIFLLI